MAIKKIGHIVNTFGIKGMIKISVSTSTPETRFAVGKKVIIKNQVNQDQTYKITSVIHKNARIVYVGLEGFDDINQVEWIISRDVYADVKPPKGAFFYDEIVGMKVLSDQNEELGNVDKIVEMPIGPYLEINSILVPFIQDVFVQKADRKTKTIVLTKLGTDTYNSGK